MPAHVCRRCDLCMHRHRCRSVGAVGSAWVLCVFFSIPAQRTRSERHAGAVGAQIRRRWTRLQPPPPPRLPACLTALPIDHTELTRGVPGTGSIASAFPGRCWRVRRRPRLAGMRRWYLPRRSRRHSHPALNAWQAVLVLPRMGTRAWITVHLADTASRVAARVERPRTTMCQPPPPSARTCTCGQRWSLCPGQAPRCL